MFLTKSVFFALGLVICAPLKAQIAEDTESKALSNSRTLQMIIEIPAGSNKKIEYEKNKNKFLIEKINGQNRIIDFLPYPGNYGFVPSTLVDKDEGGDGDPLDVLLIAESLETGTILDIVPIALLVLEDASEADAKIIATPVSADLRIIDATSLSDLNERYPAIISIIELWFLNYKGSSNIKFINWSDESIALNEVQKWRID